MTYSAIEPANVAPRPALSSHFLRTLKNYAVLYVLGILTFLLSFPVSSITGTKPDFEVVGVFAYFSAVTLAVLISCLLGWNLVRMILVEKPDSPSRAMLHLIRNALSRDRLFNFFHMLVSISLFMVGFAVLKGAIAVLNPFEWDQTFSEWDKALHFGRLPHEYLSPLLASPSALSAFNLLYNIWFVAMIGSLLVAGGAGRGPHMQFLISFVLTWVIAGFFMATAFSSAGPAFYELAGFGTDYVPLMTALYDAAETVALPAISTQELLWEGFNGTRDGSAGISAFPSIHVATATLIAIYANCINRVFGVLAWTFFASILIGSVLLGWHYAVDGYAGIALAYLFWKIAGRLTPSAT